MVHRFDTQRLRAQPVSKSLANYREIESFMERVFPKEERMSMWLLTLLSKLKGFVHTGIKAGGKTPFVDILSTDANFDVKKAKKLLRGIPMKLFPPNQEGQNHGYPLWQRAETQTRAPRK